MAAGGTTPGTKSKLPYIIGACYAIIVFIMSCHCGYYAEKHPSVTSGFDIFSGGIDHFGKSPLGIFPIASKSWFYFTMVMLVSAIVFVYFYADREKRKVSMRGKEGGTAKWNTKLSAYNKTYTDPPGSSSSKLYPSENAILSDEVFLSMNTRQTQRNNNVMVIGGSGSGKSRFYVKPNLLQANASYVCTDPAGELLASTGTFLEKQGYEIKVFNLMQMRKSHRYNPFRYVHADKEEEVLTMIDCLIENTTSSNKKGGDQFWESAEKTLLRALCYYLIKYEDPSDQNWSTVMFLLRQASVDEEHADYESNLDKLFNAVAKKEPNSIAVTQYQSFKQGAGKTLKSILISCSVRLSVFDIEQLANLTNEDDMDLTNMGMQKRAYFVITPQTTESFNFLVAMLYSQMFQVLYEEGNKLLEEGKRFNYEVRFLLDEFVNIGRIPQFDVKIATMRKYRISCSVILQAISQLEPLYEAWDAIVGNCDSMIFLGGIDKKTTEYISDILGSQTIRKGSASHSLGGGKGGSANESISYDTRKLMNPDELTRMDNRNCIVIVRSLLPFFTKKFRYERHPNYQLTGDANPELLYENTMDNMSSHPEEQSNTSAAPDQPAKSIFEIEKEIRNKLKEALKAGTVNITDPVSFFDLNEKIKIETGNNVFEQMSIISTEVDNSSELDSAVSTEIGKSILRRMSKEEAKRIILKYKNSSAENKLKKKNILEEVAEESPEEVDEWAEMFLTKK